MKNKKIIIIVIISFIVGGIFNNLIMTKNNVYIPREVTKKGTFKNALSMMLETDLDSGEYERSTGTQWPTDGYIFNKELSKCENGGELDWDSVNNQVLMIGASSDKCYVYFDKYTSVVINNLSLTSTPTSITATISATAGSASISKYMFSINNGAYIESDSNVHTFVSLNSSTEYSISVKAIDSNGKTSSVTTETIETSAYVLPSITNVTPTTAWNQIKVTVSASAGTNNISKYYYSINGGTYQESTNNTYTFTGLNASTSYTIKTKVVDTAGKYSSERTDTISTAAYVLPVISNLSSSVTTSSITVTTTVTKGTGNISKYYYSKDGGSSYTESTSNSFTFTGLSAMTTYNVKVYVKDSNGKSSSVYSKSIKTSGTALATYIQSLYTGTQGANGLYYHTSSLSNGAGDNSYRYAGANPNNYVCFGSTASTCPTDNLYRIIGVFNDNNHGISGKSLVKLMKYDYASSSLLGTNGDYSSDTYLASNFSSYKGSLTTINKYFWDKNGKNVWTSSALNTVNLNTNFLTNIGSSWASKIIQVTWKVSGFYQDTVTVSNIFSKEITNATLTFSAKVGLGYGSDYGYAAPPSAWTSNVYDYDSTSIKEVNWMYMGLNEWLLSPYSESNASTGIAAAIFSRGNLEVRYGTKGNGGFAIRPCFYLNSNVIYSGVGNGDSSNPYRIVV